MACKILLAFLFFSAFLPNFCYCFNGKLLNNSQVHDPGFSPAVATWYKDPTIAGSGGACGLENDITKPPYNAMITAGNQALFKHGKGCGACYQVKCTASPMCSGAPIRVTLTDECPGSCNDDPVHFDLSWIAFGFMAKNGQADPLRNLGRIDVQYRRVPCFYPRTPISFKVDEGSNHYWLAVAVEDEDGEGDIGSMEFQPAGSNIWIPTSEIFGATYGTNMPGWAIGRPISIRLTQILSRKSIVAQNVIPGNYQPGQSYLSNENF